MGHETGAVVVMGEEVKQINTLLPHLREVLQAYSDYLGKSHSAKHFKLVRLQELPVVLEHQKELNAVLKVLVLAFIRLDALYNIQGISNASYGLFGYELGLEDGDDGA